MSRLAHTALILGCLLPAAARADAVTVTGKEPRREITVTIENATVDVVLESLHKRYGFEVMGLENAKRDEPLSTTLSGSLHSVIERLLRNWNHMIVRSPENESGIAKVMILNATYGALPQRARPGTVNASDPMMQALTDGEY